MHAEVRLGDRKVHNTPDAYRLMIMQNQENPRYGARPVKTLQTVSVPGLTPRRGPPKRLEVPPCAFDTLGTQSKGKELLAAEKKQKVLNMMQWNSEGIQKKKLSLANKLHSKKIDIACFQETHLNPNLRFQVRGYQTFRLDREGHKGGVMILVKTEIPAIEIKFESTEEEAEMMGIEIQLEEEKWTIYNIYCPQTKSLSLGKLKIPPENCIIMGDFNARSERWGYPNTDIRGAEIEDWEIDNNLVLLNSHDDPPTFYSRAHLTTTTPDLAFATGDVAFKSERMVEEQLSTSDHKPILIQVNAETAPAQNSSFTRWNYKKANWEQFKRLADTNSQHINARGKHVDRMYAQFKKAILEAAKTTIPRGNRKNYKPYWTEEIGKLEKKAAEARELAERNATVPANIAFKKATAALKKATSTAARETWKQKTESLNFDKEGKKLWKLVKTLNDEKTSPRTITLKEDGNLLTGKKAANRFIDIYASISKLNVKREKKQQIQEQLEHYQTVPEEHMCKEFNMQELEEALTTLQDKKSPGKDEVSNEMLKQLGCKAKKTLLKIFNSSWKYGCVPHAWKEAIMVPIPKKGKDATQPQNYRPISLLSCTGKLMEKMVNTRLMWHLEKKEILIPQQAGFRKMRATEDQVTHIAQEIEDGFQRKEHTLALWIDMEKAFDKVWRLGLKEKLQEAGVEGNLAKWIRNYLKGRTARVKVQGKTSHPKTMEEGVPQGGILSPTLFLVYINDILQGMPKNVHGSIYADDVALWITHSNMKVAEQCMQKALKKLQEWTEKWELKVNEDKTTYTIFSLSNKPPHVNLKIDGKALKPEKNPTYLGITLDQRLTWANQLTKSQLRAKMRMNMMRRIAGSKWGANKNVLKKIYTARIRPVLEYGITAWSTAAATHMKKTSTLQNQAMRIITGAIKSTPITCLETATELESMEERRDSRVTQMAEKIKRMENHPLHKRLHNQGSGRLQRSSFIKKAKSLAQSSQATREASIEPVELYRNNPPWRTDQKLLLLDSIPGIEKKNEQPEQVRKALTLEYLSEHFPPETWTQVFTDGSAEGAIQNGGGGIFYQKKNGSSTCISIPTGKFSSNFKAEAEAIKQAALELQKGSTATINNKIVILTDALSVISALQNPKRYDYDTLRKHLLTLQNKFEEVAVQWIPSHCGLLGNEKADQLAKAGALKNQNKNKISYHEMKTIIKRERKADWDSHHPKAVNNDSLENLNREGQVIIFRLRTGHCRLKGHLYNKFKIGDSGRCPCNNGADMTPEHILQECKLYEDRRRQVWPEETPQQQKLYGCLDDLKRTVQFVQKTGLNI